MPAPVGPHILCPLVTKKSISEAVTSSGPCALVCAASTKMGTPYSWARFTHGVTGVRIPVTFEQAVTVTRRVLSSIREAATRTSGTPEASSGQARYSHRELHGKMFE